jgi:hypothetical protein
MDMVEERATKERPKVEGMYMMQECPTKEGRDIDELILNGSLRNMLRISHNMLQVWTPNERKRV